MRPHRRQPTRLPRPWDSPGKNTGVGCHFLLQCRKVKSESEVTQPCPTLSDPMDCSLPGSSVDGIFQARVLEWGAIAFSAGCSQAPAKGSGVTQQGTGRGQAGGHLGNTWVPAKCCQFHVCFEDEAGNWILMCHLPVLKCGR